MIHQIYITDSPSQTILDKIDLIRARYEHTLWGDKEIRQLFADYFEPDVLWAYDELIPFSYKADLARYAILYIHGGWYIDISFKLTSPLPVRDLVFFKDMVPNCMGVGMIYSDKENPIFRKVIDIVISNCKSKYYGNHPVDCTGPGALGKAFNYSTDQAVGELKVISNNFCFVIANNIVAIGKKAGAEGGLYSLGDSSGGNYFHLWEARKVYKSELK
jgi:mannosyltransferase OCH1-like enzyme